MRIIERDGALLHDYNLITTIFVGLDPFVISARILDVRRKDSPALRSHQ